MQFAIFTLPLMALLALVYASTPTVTIYKDANCKHEVETIKMSRKDKFHCYAFKHTNAPSVKFSSKGFKNRAWGVWDADYCAADTVGSTQKFLGKCLAAKDFGLVGWFSAHIGPYNPSGP